MRTPTQNTMKHWALYELARHEEADDPWTTTLDIWDSENHFPGKQNVSAALAALADNHPEFVERTRTGQGTEYAYRLTSDGKEALRTLGVPDCTPDREKNPVIGLSVPSAVHTPESDSTSQTVTDSDDAETDESTGGDEERAVFVGDPYDGQKRHVYERRGMRMERKCGTAGGRIITHPQEELELRMPEEFASHSDACEKCIETLEIQKTRRELDIDVESLLAGGANAPESISSDDVSTDTSPPATINLEPDWGWLAVALSELGHPHLARRAMDEDLTPAEVYGPVLDILYKNRGEYTTPRATGQRPASAGEHQ